MNGFHLSCKSKYISSAAVSRYWLFVFLYYSVCFASPAACAAAQWNGSGKWPSRKIQPILLLQLLPPCFTSGWFFGLITVWCNGQLYWHHCGGNKWTRKVCGNRATPSLLAWLLKVELKLHFQIFLEFCFEEQLFRVWLVNLLPFSMEMELIIAETKPDFIYWLLFLVCEF